MLKEPCYYLFDFYRTGSERPSQGDSYAVIGEYDYFLPSRLSGELNDALMPDLREVVYELNDTASADVSSNWPAGGISSGLLMRFDLHDGVSSMAEKPLSGQKAVAKCMAEKLGEGFLFFGSLSLCSIYMICDLKKRRFDEALQHIFKTCEDSEIQSAVLRSTTVPFGKPDQSDGGAFEVEAFVRITSPLVAQGKISQTLITENKGIQVLSLTGDDDLLIKTGKYDFHRLLTWLGELQQKKLHTRTSLIIDYKFPENAGLSESSSTDPAVDPEKFYDYQSKVRSKVKRLLRQIEHDRAYLPTAFVNQLKQTLNAIADTTPSEQEAWQHIPEILDILRDALLQRRVKRTDVSLDTDLQRSGLSLGAYFSLRALDRIAKDYYEGIRAALPDSLLGKFEPWHGLVLASDRHGFAALPYGIILVPYRALLDPISPQGYWNTLSHEVAHLFSAKIVAACLVRDVITPVAKRYGEYLQLPVHEIRRHLEHDANEISAHWIDFLYPYAGDFERYARSIWTTWAPLLAADPKDYRLDRYLNFHLRTFCVYLCTHAEESVQLPKELPTIDSEEFCKLESGISRAFGEYWAFVPGIKPDVMRSGLTSEQNHMIELKLVKASLRLLPVLYWLKHNIVKQNGQASGFSTHTVIQTLFQEKPSYPQKISALVCIVNSLEQEATQ